MLTLVNHILAHDPGGRSPTSFPAITCLITALP